MKKLTTKEWIEKVKENHDDRYIYDDKCVYTGAHKKITIYCKKHGYFTICADSFMKGANCPKCNHDKRVTDFNEYIKRANKVHNSKYSYNEQDINDGKRKIRITCPIHGEFCQDKFSHLNGQGCPKCNIDRKKNRNIDNLTKEFINKAISVHGNKYDYSKVIYLNAKTKICIICPKHGEFYQTPCDHLSGKGCKLCANEKISKKQTLSYDDFINKAISAHGDKYTYHNDYKGTTTKIRITCPIHGDFYMRPSNHIYKKQGCPKCGLDKCIKSNTMTTTEFINNCKKIHNYDYSITEYNGWNENIKYICHTKDKYGNEHGIITQKASAHYNGSGCPKCNTSHLESELMHFFDDKNIKYTYQKKFNWLGRQSLDFYLEEYGIAIECQGEQHYKPVTFFGGEDNLDYVKKNDEKKYSLCSKNNIPLIYYTHIQNDGIYCSNLNDLSSEIKYMNEFKNFKEYIETIYNGKIISNKNYLDIPDKNIIFYFIKTYNGNNKNDLLELINKTEKKTIIIYDYEYQEHKDIVNNKISYMLGLSLNKDRVAARKCTIQVIKQNVSKLFLNNNHIQGNTSATIHLGAYYDNKLVAVMLFKRENDNGYNLVRFATDNNLICQGIGGKMFSFFIKNYDYDYIKTFADRRWTNKPNDNLYIKLGFKLDDILEPDYQYYYDGKLIHKFNCRKNRLNKKYNLPLSMTETQMVDEIGMKKVWTCGLLKYLYKKS